MKRPLMRQRRRLFGPVLWLLLAALGVVLIWLAGLAVFARYAALPPAAADEERLTDAIVVLTGGSERLSVGFDLLARDRADKLFVSGVYHGVEVIELLAMQRDDPAELECCVVLGYEAADTEGNAQETAAWMRAEGYRSLRLVTANYHMPRSLVEFRRHLPEVEIVAHPVVPQTVHLEEWWRWPGTTSLLANEYNKFLFARLRALVAPTVSARTPDR